MFNPKPESQNSRLLTTSGRITGDSFGRLVVRPDSGDPADTCKQILKILCRTQFFLVLDATEEEEDRTSTMSTTRITTAEAAAMQHQR